MASRLGESDQDLQHFVSLSPWSADVLLEALAKATATTPSAYWIIDETSFPKAGSHSAGVQRQYCGALGKTANCQLAVSLHRADEAAGTSQPLAWRLFLPESWVDDSTRCQRAGVPPAVVHQSKQDLALGLLDQALGWQSPAGVVLADEAYGGSFEWRLALRERDLFYCVRVPWTTTAWQEAPRFGEPSPVRPGLSRQARCAAQPRAEAPALHRPRTARLGVEEGDLASGHQGSPQRSLLCHREPLGSAWLEAGRPQPERVTETALIEWPDGEPAPTRYWLARLPKKRVALAKLVATAKARWRVEAGLPRTQGRTRAGSLRGPLLAGLPPPRRPGHRRVRVPAPGAGPPAPPRTKKACRRRPCRRCAAHSKPPSSA